MLTTLLIVDDSSFSRRMINRCLPDDWNVFITEATGGRQALALCETHHYDILFLDLTMPDIDGLEVLKALKSKGIRSKIFIISADTQQTSKDLALRFGADDFIEKPIDTTKLRAALSKHGVLT